MTDSIEVMEQRYRLVLEYCGAAFHGWQYQHGVPTIEGVLRQALSRLTPEFETHGASRTDAGVHALGQCCLVTTPLRMEPAALARALNALTPRDVAIRRVDIVDANFHPRFSAMEKRYLYRIVELQREPVFGRGYAWYVRQRLDLERLREASMHMVGRHDFAAFQNRSKDPPEDSVREIRALEWRRWGQHLFVQVIGTGFLFRMVRNLVGTLYEVGRGYREPHDIASILASLDRCQAGVTAPPEGLYLMEIRYPDDPPCSLDDEPPLF